MQYFSLQRDNRTLVLIIVIFAFLLSRSVRKESIKTISPQKIKNKLTKLQSFCNKIYWKGIHDTNYTELIASSKKTYLNIISVSN